MATCPTCRTHYPDDAKTCAADGAELLPDAAFTGADVDLVAGAVVADYVIEAKIGQGGFGAVYKAVVVPLPPKTIAATAVRATADSRAQIAALTVDGVALVPTLQSSPRTFGPPGSCDPKLPLGCVVAFKKAASAGSLVDLRAADVDGDGVQDLIVAAQAGLQLYRGKAVKP